MMNGKSSSPVSSDSEDSMPLGSIVHHTKFNTNSSLHHPVLQRCEFCDKLSISRYESMKHNATHIIIPLLKLTLYQCDDCLFHFASLDDLRNHATSKNHITSQFLDKELSIAEHKKLMQSIVQKQVVVKCHDTLSEVLSHKGYKTIKMPVLSLPLSPKTEKASETVIDVWEISSDSENQSTGIDLCDTDTDEEQDTTQNIQDTRERANGDPGRDNGDLGSDNGDLESVNGDLNSENGLVNYIVKGENIDSEPELSSPVNSFELERSSSQIDLSSPLEPTTSRIIFEDDYDDDLFQSEEILPDIHPIQDSLKNRNKVTDTYANLNISSINNSGLEVNRSNANWLSNSIVLGSQINERLNGSLKSDVQNQECYGESVHYHELIAPMVCDCRYCGRCFPNRFELIKHEATHMRARPKRPILCCVCERYLSGNHWTLKKHMQKFHPFNATKRKLQRCNICHFQYNNYTKHIRYYHQTFHKSNDPNSHCTQELGKNGEPKQTNYKFLESDSQVIKMCEMCLAFAKNTQKVHYEVMGTHSEVGTRQQCRLCHNVCFEVSLVKRRVKAREYLNGCGPRRKPLSNQERLKKMQNRLKMVKRMNKC